MNEKLESKKEKPDNTPKIPVPECGYFLGTIYFYLTEGCNLKVDIAGLILRTNQERRKSILFLILNILKIFVNRAKSLECTL